MQQKIIILDFGSQTTQLIGRRVRELDTFCEILPYNKFPKDDPSVIGVILSGSPFSVHDPEAFQVDLSQFNGMAIRIGIHYVSYDAFLCQIDDFTVGPENGEGEVVDYGNVVRYDILVDGEKIGESQTASYIIPVLSAGTHTVGIKAIYQSGESEIATYTIEGTAGIAQTAINAAMPTAVYSLSGVYMGNKLEAVPAGIYLVKHNGKTIKIRK